MRKILFELYNDQFIKSVSLDSALHFSIIITTAFICEINLCMYILHYCDLDFANTTLDVTSRSVLLHALFITSEPQEKNIFFKEKMIRERKRRKYYFFVR